jgi:hypothetical protein
MKLLSLVLTPRGLVMLALVVVACWASNRYSAHHEGDSVFTTLYMHLVPAPLVEPHEGGAEHTAAGAEGEAHTVRALVELPLIFNALAFMDYRGPGEHSDGPKTALFNLQIFQVLSVVLIVIAFAGVPRYLRTGKGDPLTRLFAGFAQWIRDDMVYPTMGKELGAKFLPYFLSVFFFVLFMNLIGLVPFAATPTASIFVTAGLALTTFLAILGCGMFAQGPIALEEPRAARAARAVAADVRGRADRAAREAGLAHHPSLREHERRAHGRAQLHGPDLLHGPAVGHGRRLGHGADRRRLRRVHHDHRELRGHGAGLHLHPALDPVRQRLRSPRALVAVPGHP